jgi:hypothetical protein
MGRDVDPRARNPSGAEFRPAAAPSALCHSGQKARYRLTSLSDSANPASTAAASGQHLLDAHDRSLSLPASTASSTRLRRSQASSRGRQGPPHHRWTGPPRNQGAARRTPPRKFRSALLRRLSPPEISSVRPGPQVALRPLSPAADLLSERRLSPMARQRTI